MSDAQHEEPENSFGPNQWLVDELRAQFEQDPRSVDPTWAAYFTSHPRTSTDPGPETAATTRAHEPAEARPAAKPEPAERCSREKESTVTHSHSGISSASDRPRNPTTEIPALTAFEPTEPEPSRMRGPAAAIVKNMDESLTIPTATSVRDIPVKLMFDNREVINGHLRRMRDGKVSFTHLIGYAMVEAISEVPDMNNGFEMRDGKPTLLTREDINFGLAIDIRRADGRRGLVVPNIKGAGRLSFRQFRNEYDRIVKRARAGQLTIADFEDTTVSLTNPGGIGTVHSVPRLMKGQGVIVGVGAMNYPAAFQGASPETLSQLAISKVMTLTSTYDHRVIQGATSGEFLKVMATKLMGLDGFYERIFTSMRVPYEPIQWVPDNPLKDSEQEKFAHVMDLIHAYRTRGHLVADIDPLQYRQRKHPDLDVSTYGLTLWDLDRTFPTRGFGGTERATLRDIIERLRDAYSRTTGVEYMHLTDPE